MKRIGLGWAVVVTWMVMIVLVQRIGTYWLAKGSKASPSARESAQIVAQADLTIDERKSLI